MNFSRKSAVPKTTTADVLQVEMRDLQADCGRSLMFLVLISDEYFFSQSLDIQLVKFSQNHSPK